MIWKITMHEISAVCLGIGSILCGVASILKLDSAVVDLIEWELMSFSSTLITFTIVFDWISLMFLCLVLLISSSVLYYSGSYMSGDFTINRFMYLVLAFVGSMGLMVLSPNLISILLGWDGLGLVSYALVIYYQNEKSANAGMLTVLSNRVGDVAILLSIGLMSQLGSWNFFLYSYYMSNNYWISVVMLMVLASMTKSAQIPFSAWLPAAMAAPTPVSALVHSSTLVTAGVYLMIRFSPALEGSSVQSVLLIISCLTMFMAGVGANFEYDLKKIIALSTLSQLGVMLSILALGYPELAFFHLLSHALFKALLFMCAGVIIHSVSSYQDIRSMGSLVKFMPLTVSFMSLANLSLCGFPFLSGFYSKDMILELAFMSEINFIALVLYFLATGLTVAYSFRLIYYSLSGSFNLGALSNVSDSCSLMSNSMMGLGVGAVMGGAVLSWGLFPEPYMICLSGPMKNSVLLISILGGSLGYILNLVSLNSGVKSLESFKITSMMGSMWFMPLLSTVKNSDFFLASGGMGQKISDKGWGEFLGAQGVSYLGFKMFEILNKLHLNSIKVIMKMLVITSVVILLMFI